MLRKDLQRAYEVNGGSSAGSRAGWFLTCLRSPGIHAVIVFRWRNWLRGRNILLKILLGPLVLYLDYRMRSKWGIEIHPGATIGEGFVIFHHGGIFISSRAVIGKNFSIAHDVTIGTDGTGARFGAPTIGDNVSVNPGAKVHGKIAVGNNVHIGPNTVVNRNVPDNALVHLRAMQVVTFPGLYGKQAGVKVGTD